MPDLDILALAEPLSQEEPCGPDLEELGDPEYWQFTGAIETELPTTFDTFFEARKNAVDYSDKIKACYELLERTRDLRLFVWLAKLTILSRDLTGFADSIAAIVTLMENQWETVHPLPFEGDQTMRMVTLERLDERPSVELPLQYVRLIEDQTGPVAFRDHLVAEGEVQPREGERFRSGDDLRKTLTRCDIELLVTARDRIDGLRESVGKLGTTWLEKAGFDQAMQLERLPALLDRVFAYLDGALGERRPDLASDEPAAGDASAGDAGGEASAGGTSAPSSPRGAITSPHDVVRALKAVSAYFEEHEPSCPARLLVMQSQGLVGRSWIDIVQTLMPDLYDMAFISVDGPSPYRLPLSALSDRLQIGNGYDSPPSYDEEEDDSGEESAGDGETPTPFVVAQRADAGALLGDVVAYYRRVEPSSPLPSLLERAQQLLSRDFTSIIKEIQAAQEE